MYAQSHSETGRISVISWYLMGQTIKGFDRHCEEFRLNSMILASALGIDRGSPEYVNRAFLVNFAHCKGQVQVERNWPIVKRCLHGYYQTDL